MQEVRFGELTDQPLHSLSDRAICRILEEIQPDINFLPMAEKEIALLKALKAELLRRTFLQVEQQKQEYQDYKIALAG